MTLEQTAKECRLKVLDLIYNAQTSHIGSNYSCTEIMTAIFNRIDLDKDKFILSKGWAAANLYYFLWKKGRITEEQLNSYCQDGSDFIGLAEPIHPDIPFAGGSMGMGLPAAVGFALSKKLKGEEGTIYVLGGEGEMNCGTTFEAILLARHHKLGNLVYVIDYNKLQAMGKGEDILEMSPLHTYFNGWGKTEINGHSFPELELAFENQKINRDRPLVIIAHTVKGKGVSFMENNNIWHYKAPEPDEYAQAKKELL